MMSLLIIPSLSLMFLLMIPGVYGSSWGVHYGSSQICALKNSSVIMSCNYTYLTGYQITKVFWSRTLVKNAYNELTDLSMDPEYSQRLQYLGDEQNNCTTKLSHVTQKDSHMYYFRFITEKPDGKWTGDPGVSLTVTDLQVESPETVKEGRKVSLTCKSSCALTDRATFIWYRNSQPLTERGDRNNQLLLQSVRREDAGRYSCGVQGHTYISPAVQLTVTYPPRNVSLFINGSAETVEEDSVTLICSSDSNPPALNFSWFQENQSSSVGSGQSFSALQSGRFYCEAHNQHGSKKSAVILVTVRQGLDWPVWLGITVACVGLFLIIIIIIIIILKIFNVYKTRRKRRSTKAEVDTVKQDDLYANVNEKNVQLSESAICDDALYASILYSKSRRDRNDDAEEIQYVTVQHHKTKPTKRAEENESQYDNLMIHQPAAAVRQLDVETVEEVSVIYSSVK
ncbi:B-cell receptor CD22-like [Carassius auratus]|uniref:B-cell receptor CD22 n=1 Tax=Carassius auratus TaxID=7957 RepID=A0A6P6PLS5_CARAU|nr:B-cell receptor CD22-like [Carassius auratus]